MSATSNSSADEAESATGPSAAPSDPFDPKPRRYKRRKIAIFLSYCGAGYQGMQKNPGARTIEGELEEALFLEGAVPESDRGKPKSYDWARATRTDKGVSATGQVRAWGFKRVTASFNAKKFCDRRRYVYLLPVFALDPNAHPDRESVMASVGLENELARCLECSERGRKVVGLMGRQQRKASKEEESSELGGNESGIAIDVDACGSIVNQESSLRNEEGLGDEGKNEVDDMEIKFGDGKGDNSILSLESVDADRKLEIRIGTFELCELEVSIAGEANVTEGHSVLENKGKL